MFGLLFYVFAILIILFNMQAFFINEEFLIFICIISFGFILITGVRKLLVYYLFFEIKSIYLYFQFLLFNNIYIMEYIFNAFTLLEFQFSFNFIGHIIFLFYVFIKLMFFVKNIDYY